MENKRTKDFMELLVGLEAVEFVGLCKFLGVGLMEENYESAPHKDESKAEDVEVEVEVVEGVDENLPKTSSPSAPTSSGLRGPDPSKSAHPRDFADLFQDLLEKFAKLSRPRQRELIKILKKVNK